MASALVAAVLVGCGGPAGSAPDLLSVEHAAFQLTLPDGWSAEPVNNVEGQLQTVAYLSNLPLNLECNGAGAERHCREPQELAEGSMLVTWLAAFCAGSSCVPPPGQPILVGGREASLVQGSAVCEEMEPTDEETYFVAVTPQRLDAIVVCSRDAPETADSALRDMLEHVDWQTP
ncbi:MAG TPA: hypothetical protein VFH90_09010 [Candidatus Limnocylindria bacterium]|nr:hypothetical protein [Candidatus Limnocylindria bacterium]